MDIEAVLLSCLSNDNAVRRAAEKELSRFAKQPEAVPQLLVKVQQSADAQVRQLAAVVLRKRIASLWPSLPQQVQHNAKSDLLHCVVNESVHPVRRAIADVISSIAKHTLPKGEWSDLLDWLYRCSQSVNEDHREVALTMFCSLQETIGDFLSPHFNLLHSIFLQGLQDSSDRVRVSALRSVAALVQWAVNDQHLQLCKQLVPTMLQVGRHCLLNGDDDSAVLVFEILTDLAEQPAPLLNPLIPLIVTFSMEVSTNTQLELNTREQALQVVHWLGRYKGKALIKSGVLRELVAALCQLCAEPEADGLEDAEQLPAHKFASQALDALALHLPSKHVFPEVLRYAEQHIVSSSAPQRGAACIVIIAAADGCAEAARKKVNQLLEIVLHGLKDGDAKVRGHAAIALAQLSSCCQPDISERHSVVLPFLFQVLSDPDSDVQQRACHALDAFCENLEAEDMRLYLQPLMTQLLPLLATNNTQAYDVALSAISSAAHAAKDAFLPYVQQLLPALQHFMQVKDDQLLLSRARATECFGIVAESLPPQDLQQILLPFMELAVQGFELEFSELSEYSHGMFANVAKALGESFAHYLPVVMPLAVASLNQDDGTVGGEEREADGALIALSSDEEEDDGERAISIRTGVLDEKASAAHALGVYAESTKAAFASYIQNTLELLQSVCSYFHEDVRAQAYEALPKLVEAAKAAVPGPGVPSELSSLVDSCMTSLINGLKGESDKVAASCALEAITALINTCGPALCAKYMSDISTVAVGVLNGDAVCQAADESEDDEDDEAYDDSDADEELFGSVADVLSAMAACLGAQNYAQIFTSSHFDPLLKRMRAVQPAGIRCAVVGCLAEICRELGPHMAPLAPRLVLPLLKELRCSSSDNQRNAAFAVGLLMLHAPAEMAPHLNNLLTALHPLFSVDAPPGVRDNACGAVGRMMLSNLAQHMPLEQVMPVLLGALPLREDFDEAESTYCGVCHCLSTPQLAQRISAHAGAILSALATATAQPQVPDSVKGNIATALRQLQAAYPQHYAALAQQLPDQLQAALAHALQTTP